jgi:hypothetical protein
LLFDHASIHPSGRGSADGAVAEDTSAEEEEEEEEEATGRTHDVLPSAVFR